MSTTIISQIVETAGTFSWTVTDVDSYLGQGAGDVQVWGDAVSHYSTNDEGRGLWAFGRQILGTSQFSLADCSPGARRCRVVKFHE